MCISLAHLARARLSWRSSSAAQVGSRRATANGENRVSYPHRFSSSSVSLACGVISFVCLRLRSFACVLASRAIPPALCRVFYLPSMRVPSFAATSVRWLVMFPPSICLHPHAGRGRGGQRGRSYSCEWQRQRQQSGRTQALHVSSAAPTRGGSKRDAEERRDTSTSSSSSNSRRGRCCLDIAALQAL
jgi:hypothetical protein